MPKKYEHNKKTNVNKEQEEKNEDNNCVKLDKNGNISIQILAKPASESNKITGMDDDGVKVRINAPPVEGEANTELVKYMANVLQLRKSDLTLAKGARSKHKTLLVLSGVIKYQDVIQRIKNQILSG